MSAMTYLHIDTISSSRWSIQSKNDDQDSAKRGIPIDLNGWERWNHRDRHINLIQMSYSKYVGNCRFSYNQLLKLIILTHNVKDPMQEFFARCFE
jgi:hypothetical protein